MTPLTALTEFLTLDALAQSLGVSKSTVWRWRDELELPCIRLGSRTYFHEPAVAAWLKSQERTKSPDGDGDR